MFREPSDKFKQMILEGLQRFFWIYASGFTSISAKEGDESNMYLVLALNPDFAEKLVRSSGGDAEEIQQLIHYALAAWNNCLVRAIELALSDDPIRKDSLRELFFGLMETYQFIREKEIEYRGSLVADRGEQSLPDFLMYSHSPLAELLIDYIDQLVEEMEIPSTEFVNDLIAECDPKEVGELTAGIQLLGELAAKLLDDETVTQGDLHLMLLSELQKILLSDPPNTPEA